MSPHLPITAQQIADEARAMLGSKGKNEVGF
jgi:uncharacterized protein (DUF849 family)